FNGLAEPHVVGDEEIHARQKQPLAQGLQLISVDPDAGAKGRLEKPRVGRGDAVPAQRVQVGRKELGWVETAFCQVLPGATRQDLWIDLLLPKRFELLALGVVIEAGKAKQSRVAGARRRHDFFDQILPLANANDLAWLGHDWHRT